MSVSTSQVLAATVGMAVSSSQLFALGGAACCTSGVRINEIRVTHPGGSEAQEYFELRGDPGTSLDCLHYVVLGPGGVVEELVDLTGGVIGPTGVFLVAQASFNPALFPGAPAPNLVTTLNFVNGGNRTHLLCCSCEGLPGIDENSDLDQNNDGILDVIPWACVVDCIGLVQTPGAPPVYCPTTRGPTATGGQPAHVYRCRLAPSAPAPWRIGVFPLPSGGGLDTPGQPNPICPPSMTFSGIPHAELGGATLDLLDPTTLMVSNIGSSGEDGVAVITGPVDYLCVALELPFSQPSCVGAELTCRALAGNGDEFAAISLTCEGADTYHLSPTFDGASSVSLHVFNGETLVADFPGITPEQATNVIVIYGPCPNPPCPIIIFDIANPHTDPTDPLTYAGAGFATRFTSAVNVQILIGQGTTVLADRIVLVPTLSAAPPTLATAVINADDLAEFVLLNEPLGQFGLPHAIAGSAVMQGIDLAGPINGLHIERLGTGGAPFGVSTTTEYYSVEPEGVVIGLITFPDLAGPAPVGATFDYDSTMTIGGQSVPFVSLKTVKTGENSTQLTFDSSALNAYAADIGTELYLDADDVVIGAVPASGPVLTQDFSGLAFPGQKTLLWINNTPGPYSMAYFGYELSVPWASPFGLAHKVIICRKILDIVIDPIDPLDMEFTVLASGGLDQFLIVSQSLIYADPIIDCPADLDGDGAVAGSDLAVMLGAWNPNGPTTSPADLNGDGKVDASDLATMLGAWGDCY